jgi:hypothetical protein
VAGADEETEDCITVEGITLREFNNEVQRLRKELMKSGILGVWHRERIHIFP